MTLLPLIALALLQGGLPQEGAPATSPAHFFILSGQSNMRGLDPAIGFTPAVQEAFGSESVIVVKDAQGGAPLHRWCEDWVMEGVETPDGRGELYQRLMGKVRTAIEGREIESVTFVWMQGERDARMQFGDVYRASLERVVGQLARDLGRDDLACVVGRLSDFDLVDERYPHWTRIRRSLGESTQSLGRHRRPQRRIQRPRQADRERSALFRQRLPNAGGAARARSHSLRPARPASPRRAGHGGRSGLGRRWLRGAPVRADAGSGCHGGRWPRARALLRGGAGLLAHPRERPHRPQPHSHQGHQPRTLHAPDDPATDRYSKRGVDTPPHRSLERDSSP